MADQNQNIENQAQQETKENSGSKNIIIIILIVVIVLLLGYFLFKNSGSDTTENTEVSITPTTAIEPTVADKPSATLSGTVSLDGPIPSGSRLGIGVKSQTNPTYLPLIEELQAVDGVAWQWVDAIEGNNYNVQAFLVDEDENLISQSQIKNVTAPESKIALSINYSSDLPPAPANSLEVSCKDQNADGLWSVNLTYNIDNPTSSALQYRLGIGTSRDGELVLDVIVKPKSPDVTQSYTTDYIISPGQTYYAAYAYADCASCDEFSPASEWEQFSCTDTN